jgi:hypothetical protein
MSVNQLTTEAPSFSICMVYRVLSEEIFFIASAPLIWKLSRSASVHSLQSSAMLSLSSRFVGAGSISLYHVNAYPFRQF